MHKNFASVIPGEFKSSLVSRNITVMGRRTSVRLEPEMWNALKEIAKREECTIHDICSLIHVRKGRHSSLTAAIRVFLMLYFRSASTEEGHEKAGHGCFECMVERARVKARIMPVTVGRCSRMRMSNGSGNHHGDNGRDGAVPEDCRVSAVSSR